MQKKLLFSEEKQLRHKEKIPLAAGPNRPNKCQLWIQIPDWLTDVKVNLNSMTQVSEDTIPFYAESSF